MICNICNVSFDDYRQLVTHIRIHKISAREYYDKFLASNENNCNCLTCGKIKTRFYGLTKGYPKYCSNLCYTSSKEFSLARTKIQTGKKQSVETIAKRLANTDQNKKELKRQSTMMNQYGSLSTLDAMTEDASIQRNLKVSEAQTGRKHTKEHHTKVIAAKRRNGTLNHSEDTKTRMVSIKALVNSSDDPPNCMPKAGKGGRGYITGYVDNLYFRSSYEEIFLLTCKKFNIKVETAETKEFRVPYYADGKRHMYYPDFYLPEFECLIEIKPSLLLLDSIVSEKINSAALNTESSNFMVLTEEDLFDTQFTWVNDLEYLLA